MNKQEFLKNLKKQLKGFTPEEINDILYDYEEHFSIGASTGKTEEEIASELGDPKDIAEQYKKNKDSNFESTAKYYTEKTKEKAKEISTDLGKNSDFITKALIILGIIILSPIIVGILGIFISLLLGGISLIIGSFLGIVSFISLASSTTGLLSSLFIGTLLLAISLLFLGIIMTILGIYSFKLIYRLTRKGVFYISSKQDFKKHNKPFMNSKIIVTLVVLLLLFVLGLSVGLFQVIKSGTSITSDIVPQIINEIDKLDDKLDFDFTGHYSNIDFTKSYPIKEVNLLNVDTSFSNIVLIPTDNEDLQANLKGEYTSVNATNPIDLEITQDGSTLNIKEAHSIENLSLKRDNLVLTIYVPKFFNKDLTINTISGSIKLNDSFNLNNLYFNTISGDFFANSIQAKDVRLTSISGNSKFSLLETQNAKFENTSGNINIDDFQGNIISSSVSGNINLYINKPLGNSTIDTKSGDISIAVHPSESLLINIDSISSSIHYNQELSNISKVDIDKNKGTILLNNGSNKLDISSTSGNINIAPKSN